MNNIYKITLAFLALTLVTSCGSTNKISEATNVEKGVPPAIVTQTKASPKDAIRKDFMDYTEFVLNGDYSKSLDYLPDAFFDIINRESMMMIMEQMLNDPSMKIEMNDQKVLGIGDVNEIENKFYSKLNYSTTMSMTIIAQEGETQEDVDETNNMMALSFEQMYGKENVDFNTETGTFKILAQKESIALSEDGKTKWKFLNMEKQQLPILQQILPEAVFEMK